MGLRGGSAAPYRPDRDDRMRKPLAMDVIGSAALVLAAMALAYAVLR